MNKWGITALLVLFPLLLGISMCAPLRIDHSAFAAEAGQATVLLGGCTSEVSVGYQPCWFERGAQLPKLRIAFLNPGEYAISDCSFGLYETGKIDSPGEVLIDITRLDWELNERGFCFLRVETKEYYPDPNDSNQVREIPLVGGFIIEMFDRGYNPVPAEEVVGWCYQVKRTTSGRTVVEECS